MEKKASLVGRLLSENQMSEAFINSMFLALSGGFQDAYTYNCRDEVFSNAQTGNVVLMSQNFLEGNFTAGLRYLFPILFFAMGVFLAENFQEHYRYAKRLHWRQVLLAAEIVILAIVGFIPSSYNMLAAMLVSFACAIQVQTFRKVGGYSYASTMCIGNLRSGTAALSMYMRDKKKRTAPSGRILFRRDSGFRHRRRNRRRVLHAVWNPRNLDFLRTSSGELPSDVTGKVPLRNKRE